MTDCRKMKDISLRWPHTKFHIYLSISLKAEMRTASMHERTHANHFLFLVQGKKKHISNTSSLVMWTGRKCSKYFSAYAPVWQQRRQYILNSQTHTRFQLWCTLNSRQFILYVYIFHTQNFRQVERRPLSLNIKTICPTANFLQKLEVSHLLEKCSALHRTWRFIMSLQPATAPFPQSNDSTPHQHTIYHLQLL